MGAQGTVIVDFGAMPSMEAIATVDGQGDILTSSKAEAWIMASSTSDNDTVAHSFGGVSFRFTCTIPTMGSGFDIYVTCLAGAASGAFEICWVWN